MMVWSATNYGSSFVSKKKGDVLQDVLNYWKDNVNRDFSIDIPVGLDNVMREWYTESWSSRLVVLYLVWGTMKYNNETWQVPVYMYIPNSYGIGVAGSTSVGNNKYYFRSAEELQSTVDLKEYTDFYKNPYLVQTRSGRDIARKYLPFKSNHSAYVSKIGARVWELLPVPYLYHKNTAILVKVKQAIRNSDYRTAIGIINDILLLKKGSKELTEAGITYGEKELSALNDLIKEKLAGSGILGTTYDTTAEHITPDVQSMLSRDKYAEIDQDILASLGFLSITIENEKVKLAELNPKPLISEITGTMKIYKELIERQIVYEIVKRNKRLLDKSIPENIIFNQKPMNIWISDEGKRLRRLLYDRGLISKREAIEVLGESDYDIQKVQREEEDKDTEVFYPPVIQNVEKDVDVSTEPSGGRPKDTTKDDIKNKETDKKQNRKEIEKNASEEYEEAPAKLDSCVEKLMNDERMIKKYPDTKERRSHAFAICQASTMKKGLVLRDEKWSEFDKELAGQLFIHDMNLKGFYLKDGEWVKSEE
jgi:hypothetical protein